MQLEQLRTDWIKLSLVPGIGPQRFSALITEFGTPDIVFNTSYAALSRVVGERCASAIQEGPDPLLWEKTTDWINRPGHQLLCSFDPDYPEPLRNISVVPPVLYLIGKHTLLKRPGLGIVGTRHPTSQGKKTAEAFAEALSCRGITIISGLANGIDTAAHTGALKSIGSTIAVMATGADLIYPSANRTLANTIAEEGLLITEFPLGTLPKPGLFPRRNRIISGLSMGCLIVEAAVSSGSLITGRLALEQGRDVFAIPGSIHSPQSKGCHQLIKQGAKLVDCIDDILDELNLTQLPTAEPTTISTISSSDCSLSESLKQSSNEVSQKSFPTVSPIEKQSESIPEISSDPILQAMGDKPIDIDTLLLRVNLPFGTLLERLLSLELTGCIRRLKTGAYQRII